ncbi:hypothetical protein CPB84DRAFT_1785040 [Gymnopilus junonius]|uniref:Novel STAND NTPase 1 domain-containing protein n=1 Tax=Gymnopilus junonius TaxID=109634 RepID=A0A9P5TLP5_GYMJU|nr:hypothetical protein CPB84DRAFT_1785040 [Gymnopilus junonius]
MPRFCLPCGPQAAKSHFDDDFGLKPQISKRADSSPDDKDISKPTTGEYAGEAAKEFLNVLQEVADSIPLPGLGHAVKLATKLIAACEDSHATLERAQELKRRIKTLVTLLVDELKGKKKEEIEQKLKRDIEALEQDLIYIQKKLDEIASQQAFLVIFFQSINKDKVEKCVRRLDNAVERFNLSREISHANLLDSLEKQITNFYSMQQQTLDLLRTDMSKVLAILYDRRETDSLSSGHRARATMPANSDIFHGRDPLVDELAHILTEPREKDQKRARVCLLGPGGMGKTSTALAVMAHPLTLKSFPERNQVWVPCVKAKSASLLLDTLYLSLGTTRNSGNTLQDILFEIRSSSEPLILLLDNFETPWNITDSRSETEGILLELDKMPHITLFITMRSSIPPCDGKQWRSFEIEAVDRDAARQIYVDICPTAHNDNKIPTLLQALGHMPLAITLMARQAKITGLGAGQLLEEYERLGTSMLGQSGLGAKRSLDVCISLSVDSQPMKECPEAYELLAGLAMLPVGTTYDVLTKWWMRDFHNPMNALQILAETSLVQRRESHFFVLPVIRSYILTPSRCPETVRTAMIKSACNFLLQNNSSPGHPSFLEHAKALSAEEGNLQAILVDINAPHPDVIKAYLVLAKHQLSTRVRLAVIEHVVNLARQMEDQALLGDVLTCYGKIFLKFNRYNDAVEQFTLAREIFLSVSNEKEAALCLLDMVETYTLSISFSVMEALQLVRNAQSVFEKLEDTQGTALCLYHLGFIRGQSGERTEGIAILTQARENLLDPLNRALCTYALMLVYYWDGNIDASFESATTAVREFKQLGQYYYLSDSMQFKGQLLFFQGNYPDALRTLFQALEACKSYGSPLCIGQTLETMGRTWVKMGKVADGKGAYEEAMVYYSSTAPVHEDGLMRCKFLSRQAEDSSVVPTVEEEYGLAAMYRDFRLQYETLDIY